MNTMEQPTHQSAAIPALGKARPVFFNLLRIRFPVTAVVSIAHRVSGVFLVVFIPALAYVLERVLAGPESFARLATLFDQPSVHVIVVFAVWALAHHALAGVRHLLFDMHFGVQLPAARTSAWAVFVIEAAIVLLTIGALS